MHNYWFKVEGLWFKVQGLDLFLLFLILATFTL